MPKVSGKKKQNYTRKKSTGKRKQAQGGALERAGAFIDNFLQRAVQVIVTYTAVSLVGVLMIFVLMLFAGGYFFNVGARIANLTKDMSKGAGFEISRVTVKGADQTREYDILNALYSDQEGQAVGRSLLHFNLNDAQKNIEQIGWVKHVAVSRIYPETVHVSIAERKPVAVWQPSGDGELFLIDTDGVSIKRIGGHQYAELPMVINSSDPKKAAGVLTELAKYPRLSAKIAALREQGNRRWDLVFRNDFVVKLPENDYEGVIAKLIQMDAGKNSLSTNLEYLDIRDSKTVYYKPKT